MRRSPRSSPSSPPSAVAFTSPASSSDAGARPRALAAVGRARALSFLVCPIFRTIVAPLHGGCAGTGVRLGRGRDGLGHLAGQDAGRARRDTQAPVGIAEEIAG